MQTKKILSEVGFEPTPSIEDQNARAPYRGARVHLESGALDHSAILTTVAQARFVYRDEQGVLSTATEFAADDQKAMIPARIELAAFCV